MERREKLCGRRNGISKTRVQRQKHHYGYKEQGKLRWIKGKDVEKKGQSLKGECSNPKLRCRGFNKEEPSQVVEGRRL